jgi:hypothetical protein
VKMTPMWFWVQAITFAFILTGAVIAITKLV